MGAMDAGRLELYELLKPKLEEEAARQLVLALPPNPERLATKDDLERLATKDQVANLESKMDVCFAQLETTLTRRMVTILGAWTILVGSTVGWIAQVLR